jgi:hypothetical protein
MSSSNKARKEEAAAVAAPDKEAVLTTAGEEVRMRCARRLTFSQLGSRDEEN